MADTQPFKQLTIYDRCDTFEAGMNSGLDPLLLKKNQLSFALNLTTRLGFVSDRPPFFKRTITYPDAATQTAVEQGLFQGAAYYQPDSGNQSLFAAISGRLFQFVVLDNTITCIERTIPGDPNPSTTTQSWIWQAENYLIWNDGASLPPFFNGVTTRRSQGPSVQLATVTAVAPASGIPIGGIGAFTLTAPWTGSFDFPVLYNGEYWQPVLAAGTFFIQLTSIYSVPGEAINVFDLVLIKPGVAGVVGNTLVLPAGNFAPNSPAFLDITLTSPYTGATDTGFINPAAQVILFGKQWFVSAVAGNSIRVIPADFGVFPATLNQGTQIQFSYSPAANVSAGQVQVATVAPGIGGVVQLTVNSAYTGTPNAIVYIGTGQYTIIGIPQAPSGAAAVDMINLSDNSVSAYPVAGPKNIIVSVPELPAGRMGAYGLTQNWVAMVDGLSYIASDASRGPSGTTANDRRDAVLKTVDLTFLGGKFSIPGAGNIITSITFMANLDVALGQGSLQIGTAAFMASNLAPFDFSNPPPNGTPLLTYSLIGTGPLAQDSTILVNSDIYFRSQVGLGSLILGRRDFGTPGNTPISQEVNTRLFDLDQQSLLSYGCATNFDNRALFSLSPQSSSQGVLHAGLVAQNLDPISGMRNKLPPVYDGLWTGVNTLKMITGTFAGKQRSFNFTFNTQLSKIELWELMETGSDHFDDGIFPIVWSFETASLFNQDVKDRGVLIRLIDGEFAVEDVIGDVRFEVYYKSDQNCWTPWHAFSICANPDGSPQYFPRLGLGEPKSDACAMPGTTARDGYTFQFKFLITGHCRFLRAKFAAVTIPIPKFKPPQCDALVTEGETTSIELPCETQVCVTPEDLTIYNLQDSLLFNGVPLSRVLECPEGYYCAPGTFPRVVTYPPGTFRIPYPPTNTGFPIVIQYKGCEGMITRKLSATASAADITAASNQIFSQAADQQARCDAIRTAGPVLPIPIHLSDIFEFTCADSVLALAIHGTSSPVRLPITFTVGSLPPFLTTSQNGSTLFLVGTPTIAQVGVYNFTVQASAPGNPVGQGSKVYTLNVIGIATTSPLSAGTVGLVYSQFLTAPTIPGSPTWAVTAGALPDGLTLDGTMGEIAGTPTTEQTAAFTILATGSDVNCSKDFTLAIAAGSSCGILASLIWGAPSIVLVGAGAASGSALAGNVSMSASNPAVVSGAFISDPQSGQINFTGGFMYTGPAINCCYEVTFNGTATISGVPPNPSSGTISFGGVYQDGIPIPASGYSVVGNGSPQVVSVPFTIAAAAVPSLIQFTATLQAGGSAGFGNLVPASNATLAIVIGSC